MPAEPLKVVLNEYAVSQATEAVRMTRIVGLFKGSMEPWRCG